MAMANQLRHKLCSVVSVAAVLLVLYNAAAHVWLQRDAACVPAPPPPPPPSCEPCAQPPRAAPPADPLAALDMRLGRWDGARAYRLFDYAAVGSRYASLGGSRRVCLATQSSVERLHELLALAAHWSGPLSVAVFVTGDELRALRGFAAWLLRCRPAVWARLALHVGTPGARPGAAGGALPGWARDCAQPPPAPRRRADTVAWRATHPYPQNHLRNLARKNCHGSHVLLLDIDVVPSRGLAPALERFLRAAPRCPLCVYVVPTYELDRRVRAFPSDKAELVRLSRKKLAVPFHKKSFSLSQRASNFSRWEASGGNESAETHVSHNVTNFELFYEPFYLAPDSVPAHDERFLGYGFTRNTQTYEMFLSGYQFQVLSPVFTAHWGIRQADQIPWWRRKEIAVNWKLFKTFKRELFARHGKELIENFQDAVTHGLDYRNTSVGMGNFSVSMK
ncbi:beta-1,4-glucuronyltransferase 1 [Plutella xylostella]|uniref:beta-1,4-glucuronyltransferase 1 n=1 Tax=Plutella xylostella TaxID=51655 RepID=UPI0020327AF3|nr:beta-1,4-glucuronyltransferase 1 [Plutella xylostella]